MHYAPFTHIHVHMYIQYTCTSSSPVVSQRAWGQHALDELLELPRAPLFVVLHDQNLYTTQERDRG